MPFYSVSHSRSTAPSKVAPCERVLGGSTPHVAAGACERNGPLSTLRVTRRRTTCMYILFSFSFSPGGRRMTSCDAWRATDMMRPAWTYIQNRICKLYIVSPHCLIVSKNSPFRVTGAQIPDLETFYWLRLLCTCCKRHCCNNSPSFLSNLQFFIISHTFMSSPLLHFYQRVCIGYGRMYWTGWTGSIKPRSAPSHGSRWESSWQLAMHDTPSMRPMRPMRLPV